jgi:flavodoxin
MPRYLVAYYSWTGTTEKVANLIAKLLSADVERIMEVNPRRGRLAFPAAVFASLLKTSPPIEPANTVVSEYDVVLLGCPVWASSMATPMRTFIMRENPNIKQVGLFCTLGGSGGNATLAQLAASCGQASAADLVLDRQALVSGAWRGLTETFAREVQAGQAENRTASSRVRAVA